jgi:hypothetical protein
MTLLVDIISAIPNLPGGPAALAIAATSALGQITGPTGVSLVVDQILANVEVSLEIFVACLGLPPPPPPEPPTPTPQTSSLTVKKEVFGCDNINSAPAFAIMICDQGPVDPEVPWNNCDLPSLFEFPSICQGLPENLFDIQVLGPQNNLIYEDVAPENGMTFDNLQPGTYTVEERKHDDNVN